MRRAVLQLSVRLLCNQQSAAVPVAQPLAAQAVCWQQQQAWRARGFSQAADQQQQQDEEEEVPEKIQQLADSIMGLTVLECRQLSTCLRAKLGIPRHSGMSMMPMMAGAPAAAAAAAPAAAEAPAEEKKEKTEFDVKLEAFSPEGKIKVIKEIRALTNLGLKEAKELVEKAPVVIKTSVSKGDAEAMKKQLEAVGGKVALE